MNTCNLNVSHLKAALICASKNDIRYYMKGVLAAIREREVLLVSSDGHRLSVIRREHRENEENSAPAEIIIPREVLKGIKPVSARATDCVLHYDAAQPLAECKLDALNDGGRTFTPIDAKYPDWTRVIPDKVDGTPAHFNPYYVSDFTDLVRILADNKNIYAEVHPNGDSCAGVTCAAAPEFLGALMSMRFILPEYAFPNWLKAPTQAPVKLKKAA